MRQRKDSESHRLAVGAAFRCRKIAVIHSVDELRAAEVRAPAFGLRNIVAASFQLGDDLGTDALFDADRESVIDAPARRIRSRLRILSVVGKANHDLSMSLGLHGA